MLAAAGLAVLAFVPTAQSASFGKGIWIGQAEIASLPTTGTSWGAIKAAADTDWGRALLSDGNSRHDVLTLAGALVYARTGDEAFRTKVITALRAIVGTEADPAGAASGQSPILALGRNLVSYVIAADLVGYTDRTWQTWLSGVRTRSLAVSPPRSLAECHALRPNNWGTHCGASRIAADLYLGDAGDLARAIQVFRGWLGDRSAYAGFSWGDTSWQGDPRAPVGINPRGATIQGYDVNGVLPDDQRRSGSFTWPPPKENYVWEALGPAYVQAELLSRAGYPAYGWSDQALARAANWLYNVALFPAVSDDRWLPWLVNAAYGTSYPTSAGAIGKGMAWTDWTHASGARGGGVPTPALPAAPSSPPAPAPTPSAPPVAPAPPTGQTGLSFTATGDAYVKSTDTRNHGSNPALRVRSGARDGNEYRTYITFTVAGLGSAPASAMLRLFVTDSSDNGGLVSATSNSWSESTITWASQPGVNGSPLGQLSAPTAGVWVQVNVSSVVTKNGTYSFVLTSSSENSAYYASRETGQGPTLVVTP